MSRGRRDCSCRSATLKSRCRQIVDIMPYSGLHLAALEEFSWIVWMIGEPWRKEAKSRSCCKAALVADHTSLRVRRARSKDFVRVRPSEREFFEVVVLEITYKANRVLLPGVRGSLRFAVGHRGNGCCNLGREGGNTLA